MHVTFSKLGQYGQFGNQLWQISAVLHYAERYGHRPMLPYWHCARSGRDFEKIFPAIREHAELLKGPGGEVCIREKSFRYEVLPKIDGNVDLVGNFQSHRYLAGPVLERMRGVLSSSNAYSEDANRYIQEKLGGDGYSAIHIRFYQSLTTDIGLGPVERLPKAYFGNVLSELDMTRPVYVASDDIGRAVNLLNEVAPGAHEFVYLDGQDQLVDFYILSRAATISIGNSSFSYWAAILRRTNKRVLAPQRWFWFDRANRSSDFWNTADLYPVAFEERLCI